jgi:hypothetical protein
MATDTTPSSDRLQVLAEHLAAIDALLAEPELIAVLGDGFIRELHYPLASFRQRYPTRWPGAQPPLF